MAEISVSAFRFRVPILSGKKEYHEMLRFEIDRVPPIPKRHRLSAAVRIKVHIISNKYSSGVIETALVVLFMILSIFVACKNSWEQRDWLWTWTEHEQKELDDQVILIETMTIAIYSLLYHSLVYQNGKWINKTLLKVDTIFRFFFFFEGGGELKFYYKQLHDIISIPIDLSPSAFSFNCVYNFAGQHERLICAFNVRVCYVIFLASQ